MFKKKKFPANPDLDLFLETDLLSPNVACEILFRIDDSGMVLLERDGLVDFLLLSGYVKVAEILAQCGRSDV